VIRDCPDCNSPIEVAYDENGNRVHLETFPQLAQAGVRRYVIVGNEGERLIVRPVADNAPGAYYADHAFDCPAGNDGR
jgi:hypothetical protein